MQTVYKYALEPWGESILKVKKGAKILCAQMQGDQCCIWCEVDSEEINLVKLEVEVVATGGRVPPKPFSYLNTVQTGPYVFHIYTNLQQPDTGQI